MSASSATPRSVHAAQPLDPDAPRRRLLRIAALTTLYPLFGAASAQPQQSQVVVWPEVTLLDGTRWGQVQAQGKQVIVVFWSTTCPFCLRHNAHIEKLRRAAAGRPLEIITVARDKDPAAVKAYLARHGYGFKVTMAQDAMAAALSNRKVIPLTVTVDRQGKLGQVIPGEMFEDDVMEWLRAG